MSRFEYTLPSGDVFVVNGPANATQAQADQIFYEQVAAGSLVNYTAGQTLTAPATQITKFELSRLDRGTAGVDTQSILAVIQGLPIVAGTPNLENTALTNPINEANIVLVNNGNDLSPDSIGPLDSYQVQKLLAQISKLVDQDYSQISLEKGIGKYGMTCYALEQAGYVKPGTSLKFFSLRPQDFVEVMSSPSVWTGLGGIYSLNDLLVSEITQNQVQVAIMQNGYQSLTAAGVIQERSTPAISVNQGQVYINGGLTTISSLNALSLLGLNTGNRLSGITRNASLPGTILNSLVNSQVTNLSTIASGAVNNLSRSTVSGVINSLGINQLASGITGKITGDVGALVLNASKFTAPATALWAKSSQLLSVGSVGGISLSNLSQTALGNLPVSLTGVGLNSITTNLTNLVPGTLGNLTNSLDVFGKAGQFATNFSNPLGALNNLGGQLSGAVSGAIGSISGAVSGQLTSLTGQLSSTLSGQLGSLTGALGNLGNLGSLGNLAGLFGGGGDLVSGTAVAGGFNNTVNRKTVDAAFNRILGSDKIPSPTYEYPGFPALAARLDIFQARSVLQNLAGRSSGVFGQTVTIV